MPEGVRVRAIRPIKTEGGVWVSPPNTVTGSAAWAYRMISTGAAVPARIGDGCAEIAERSEVAIATNGGGQCRTQSRRARRRSR
jgi:hypothetical protein